MKGIADRFLGTDAWSFTIRKGATGFFGVQVCGAVLGLIVHLVIARLLGAEQYGIYTLTVTWIGLLLVFALLGQNISVVKFLPTYIYNGTWGKACGMLRGARAIVLVLRNALKKPC